MSMEPQSLCGHIDRSIQTTHTLLLQYSKPKINFVNEKISLGSPTQAQQQRFHGCKNNVFYRINKITRVSCSLYQFQLTFLSVLVRSVTRFLDRCSVDQVQMSFRLTFTIRSFKLIVFVTDSFATFEYNVIVRTKDVTPYSLFGDFLLLQIWLSCWVAASMPCLSDDTAIVSCQGVS